MSCLLRVTRSGTRGAKQRGKLQETHRYGRETRRTECLRGETQWEVSDKREGGNAEGVDERREKKGRVLKGESKMKVNDNGK